MTAGTGEPHNHSADVVVADSEDTEEPQTVHHHVLDLNHTELPANIYMENSSDVQIGPRLHYNAPVTINQYVNVVKGSEEDMHDREGATQEHGLKATKPSVLNFPRWRPLYWSIVVLLIIGVVAIGVILHFTTKSTSSPSEYERVGRYTTIQPPTDPTPDPNITLSDGKYIFTRDRWNQYPPKFIRNLTHPTPYVVIAHTAEATCSDTINCTVLLKNIYSYHVGVFESPDIGYNFLIDSSGNVYEGRGWDATNFVNSYVTRRNIAIAFFGNYVIDEFNKKQIKSLQELLDLGVKLGKLATDYKLLAHNQVFNALSPGNNILKEINNWPHRCFENCEIPLDTTTTSTNITEMTSPITTTISSE